MSIYNSLSKIAAMLWLHEEQSMNDDFRYPLILSWTTQFCYYLFENTGGVPYGEKVSSKTHLTVPVSCHKWKNINISGVEYHVYRRATLLSDQNTQFKIFWFIL